jgi:hypothetical protein
LTAGTRARRSTRLVLLRALHLQLDLLHALEDALRG